jgi:hypothetical protein
MSEIAVYINYRQQLVQVPSKAVYFPGCEKIGPGKRKSEVTS